MENILDDYQRTNRRIFKVIDKNGVSHGRFTGAKPKQAATKALTAYIRENKIPPNEEVTIIIRECTRTGYNRAHPHTYLEYKGQKVQLDKPMVVKIAGKVIQYKNRITIKKIAKFVEKDDEKFSELMLKIDAANKNIIEPIIKENIIEPINILANENPLIIPIIFNNVNDTNDIVITI